MLGKRVVLLIQLACFLADIVIGRRGDIRILQQYQRVRVITNHRLFLSMSSDGSKSAESGRGFGRKKKKVIEEEINKVDLSSSSISTSDPAPISTSPTSDRKFDPNDANELILNTAMFKK